MSSAEPARLLDPIITNFRDELITNTNLEDIMTDSEHQAAKCLREQDTVIRQSADELIPQVYDALRKLAAWRLGSEGSQNTLQATALVHDAYLRLSPNDKLWDSRAHFFSAAAEAMRRILVERARRRKAECHGGKLQRTEFPECGIAIPTGNDDEILAVHEILERFEKLEPRKAELVKLRYFTGMTIEEAAATLGVSAPTAKRDWNYAKAWLFRELSEKSKDSQLGGI